MATKPKDKDKILPGDDDPRPKQGMKKSGVPRGYHIDPETGATVKNTGEKRGLTANEQGLFIGQVEDDDGFIGDRLKDGGGGGGNEGDDELDTSELPPGFLKRLKKAGLKVNKAGKIVAINKDRNVGFGGSSFSDADYRLMQEGHNRFGLENQHYDTQLLYYDHMEQGALGPSPAFINMTTGMDQFGGQYSDQELEHAQLRAGYDPQYGIDYYTNAMTYGGRTAYVAQDPARLQAFFEATRAVAMQGGPKTGGAYFDSITNTTQQGAPGAYFVGGAKGGYFETETEAQESLAASLSLKQSGGVLGEQPPAPAGPSGIGGFDVPPAQQIMTLAQQMLQAQQNKDTIQEFASDYFTDDMFEATE